MQWDAKAKPPELEDLVIIVDEKYPGNIWPTEGITEVKLNRVVDIKTLQRIY